MNTRDALHAPSSQPAWARTLAITGLALCAAACAPGSPGANLVAVQKLSAQPASLAATQTVTYIGDEFREEQIALNRKPIEPMPPTF